MLKPNPQNMDIDARLANHPCFNQKACHTYARIHLPVAPFCNVQCRFCNRKYSCVNESRPGVTAKLMTPAEALVHLKMNMERIPNISVVGIAGPGDPFANPYETLETFRLIHEEFPELMLCVSSNGLNVLPYVDELKTLNISHVTITVNAVDPSIGVAIYDWVRWEGRDLKGMNAAATLWENQQMALQALDLSGILIKVNTVCIPTINKDHIDAISRTIAGLGASLHNIIPLIPTANTAFANLPEPSKEEMKTIRYSAQRYLPQMAHCSRCRADAVGLLGQNDECGKNLQFAAQMETPLLDKKWQNNIPIHTEERPLIAIASSNGILINMHLGESRELNLYRIENEKLLLVDNRKMPPVNGGENRWAEVAKLLSDCSFLLVSGVGPVPRSVLSASGVKVRITEGFIQDAIAQIQRNNNEKPFHCEKSCGENKQKSNSTS